MGNTSPSTSIARNLRSNQTNEERLLWSYLRRKQLDGIKFRRQQPVGKYVVDFVSYEKKLIIELDGGQHNSRENIDLDVKRTVYLESLGYTVLRFWNNEVRENLEEVVNKIRNYTPLSNSLP